MAITLSTGPTVTSGNCAGVSGAPDNNMLMGPNVDFQGGAILDVRYPVPIGNDAIGCIKAFLDSPYILMADYVPAASAATPVNIAAAANVTSGTAMTLVSAAGSGITPNVPFYTPSGTLITSAVTLDFGFATLNCTSGSTTVTAPASTIYYFQTGQWLVIGNVGNAGGTKPLIAQVQSVNTSNNTMVLSTAPLATNATAPVGQGNILDFTNPLATATAWTPYVAAGATALFAPLDGLARGVGIGGSASATGGAFKVVGYDIYGVAMSETITAAAGVGPTYGKKAFKHIISVTPQFTDAHNYSVGTSDVFGFALRNDRWEYDNFYWAGAFLAVSTGWTAADTTNPATSTTGDVRGTLQIGTRGSLGSGASGGAANGTLRLALFSTLPAYNLIAANANNTVPLYGVTQA